MQTTNSSCPCRVAVGNMCPPHQYFPSSYVPLTGSNRSQLGLTHGLIKKIIDNKL